MDIDILETYLNKPYTKLVNEVTDGTGHYFYAEILELDGCHTTADSEVEALENLKDVMKDYIQVKLDNNIQIPEPKIVDGYSGKLVIRIPKSLHRRLSLLAQEDNVSLNQYILYKLSI